MGQDNPCGVCGHLPTPPWFLTKPFGLLPQLFQTPARLSRAVWLLPAPGHPTLSLQSSGQLHSPSGSSCRAQAPNAHMSSKRKRLKISLRIHRWCELAVIFHRHQKLPGCDSEREFGESSKRVSEEGDGALTHGEGELRVEQGIEQLTQPMCLCVL